MTSWKRGDKLRCIDAILSHGHLTLHKIYTIKEILGVCVYLEEIPDFGWFFAGRFEAYIDPSKHGELIEVDFTLKRRL